MGLAPIAVSTYSRLHHLKQTIEALQKNTLAQSSELYIFSDAPKVGDKEKVKKVRNYIHTIDGFKTVNIVERSTNSRVSNIRGGICELLDKYGRTIYMEDDNVTAPGFLQFMNDALNFYVNDKNIIAVSGYNVPEIFPKNYIYDYYLSVNLNGWGFATWYDRGFIKALEFNDAYREVMNDILLYKKINKIHPKLIHGLKQIQDGKLDAGDYKIVFHSIKNNLYTIKPIHSFVNNIGHDGSGVHCGNSDKFGKSFALNKNRVKFFNNLKYEFEIDHIFYNYFHKESLTKTHTNLSVEYPKTLNFMANNICNSRCKMCRVWDQKSEKEITPEGFSTIINDPLFHNLKYVGISGGEPTLRKDLPELFRVVVSKNSVEGTGLITNALVAEHVINQITKCNEVCMQANLPFNVMVSLDGIGKIHDVVRGRKGAFDNALKVIRHIRDKTNIELSIGCTVIKQNVWHLDEVLDFCKNEKIYGRFRIAEFINRLYNSEIKTSIRNFNNDERYQIALFFSKLELYYESSPNIKATYRNIRQMIFEGKPRESGCPYKFEAVGLDSQGNLLFCSPKSPDLGSCFEKPASIIFEESQGLRKSIIQRYCSDCIHDYHAAPSKESLEEQSREDLLNNYMSVRHSLINSSKAPSAPPKAVDWSKFRKALIVGWYGTETAGDKAIIADIIRRLKNENSQIQITVASLYPFVTDRTIKEIEAENIKIIKTHSAEYILACRSTDSVIMGGGPLMGMESLGFVLTAFAEARKKNIPCIVEGCGIGPLIETEHILAVKEILRLSTQIRVRDKSSLDWAISNTSRVDAVCTEDPAARFVEKWKKTDLQDQKIQDEEHFACFLREITLEYANGESSSTFLAFRERFEQELGKFVCHIREKTGLKPFLMPMHTFAVGEDDRDFARRFAKTYLQDGDYNIGNRIYSPQDILSVMSRSKFNICMRFHSVLFAEKLDVPFVAIDYTGGGKIKGFLKDQKKLKFMFDRTKISNKNWSQKLDSILLKYDLRNFKVVHLCSQDYGGAGKAAYRLHKGLQQIGVNSKMLVLNKKSGDPSVEVFPSKYTERLQQSLNVSSYESPLWSQQVLRWQTELAKYPNRPVGLEIFTDALSDIHIDQIQDIKDADIVNLHWVAGTLDYPSAPLALKDKQIVWTLHDMNPFSGGCHYSGDCENYKESCGTCPQLGSTIAEDMSRQIWNHKYYAFKSLNLNIVTPSKWLANCASKSSLLSNYPVKVIPNGLPLNTFKPYAKTKIRKALNIPDNAKVILFGADYLVNARKGFGYLLEALKRLLPHKDYATVVLTFGNLPEGLQINTYHTICSLGSITDEDKLALAYSAADVFVIPSIEDNLPNTVLEAMACGAPVVGFEIGGIPDMVEHKKTGYLVKPRDIEGLSEGIAWVLSASDSGTNFSEQCRKKVEREYALEVQAKSYYEMYGGILQGHLAVKDELRTKDCKFMQKNEDFFKKGDVENTSNCLALEEKKYLGRSVSRVRTIALTDNYQPLISVITPSFNQGQFIEHTIQSVLKQNYKNIEHIIIDGGSTDTTTEILKKYPHLNWESEKDNGQSHALNKGLKKAQGEIIAWINSDDWYEPGVFKIIADYFKQNPEKNVVMGNCNLIDENGNIFDKVINVARGFGELKKYWIGQSIPTQPAVFFRRKLLDQHGYIDETLQYAMDYDLWMRFAQKNHFHHLDVTVANYRFHQAAKGGDQDWKKFIPEWELVSKRYTKLPGSTPRVSVIIPCYNYGSFLRDAVESVIGQTYKDFEIIIVNDGSTDNTKEVAVSLIKEFSQCQIRLLNQENSGQPAIARNNGIAIAKGDFILPLDADDILHPKALENFYNGIKNHGAQPVIAFGWLQSFDADSSLWPAGEFHPHQMLRRNQIPASSMFHRSVWELQNGYRLNVPGFEDWDFWVGAIRIGAKFCSVGQVTTYYRKTAKGSLIDKGLKNHEWNIANLIKNNEELYEDCEIQWAEDYLSRHLTPPEVRDIHGPQDRFPMVGALLSVSHPERYSEEEVKWANRYLKKCPFKTTKVFNNWPTERKKEPLLPITAIIAAFNEGDVIYHVIRDLVEQDIQVVFIDHHSSDNTIEEVRKWEGKGVVRIESFPEDAGLDISPNVYSWRHILRRKQQIAAETGPGWYLHTDADEFRESPWPDLNLRQGIERVDREGFNAINFKIYDFKPINNRFESGHDVREHLTHYDPDIHAFNHVQIKCWKNFGQEINLWKSGGHSVAFKDRRVYPISFILRHYAIRSQHHGLQKVLQERKTRFDRHEREAQWHDQYDQVKDQSHNFMRKETELIPYDREKACRELQSASSSSDHGYYEFSRPEVQAMVAPEAGVILDVGCASGRMAGEIKSKLKAEVWGIEPVAEVARRAARILDRVIAAPVEEAIAELPDEYFDCIIFADVLEHLQNPDQVLRDIKAKLKPTGQIVASIPNVRHWSVVKDLLEGRWEYADAGILDRSHLRFFTRQSVLNLFKRTGFHILDMQATSFGPQEVPAELMEGMKKSGLQIATFLEDVNHYQYLVKGTLSPAAAALQVAPPLVSIVMLTFNELDYTRQCVNAIRKHTHCPHEIIFVDNGSTDGTRAYLDKLVKVNRHYRLIANDCNLGFAMGNNQGMAVARCDYILLMNNDLVVTPGWLERMVACAEKNPRAGIVGPMSNSVSGPQQVKDVTYNLTNLSGLDDFAEKFAKSNAGRSKRFMRVVGFCMLIKRAVVDKIGGLDSRYGLGNFEDDDFSLRAALAGFESWMAEDCFIHHFGNRTFIGAKIDYNESLTKNWEIFKKKWNFPSDLQLGAKYNWVEILNKGFVREKHYCPITSGDPIGTRQMAVASPVTDTDPLKELYQKVQGFVRDGRQEQAVKGLEELLEQDPDFAVAHNDLGILYYNQGEKEKALRHYEHAVRIEPHNLTFQKNLADIYFVEFGRVEEALAIYNKVLEVDFGDVEALMSMGLICEAVERPEDARHFYNRVLEVEPWNMGARQQMDNLFPN